MKIAIDAGHGPDTPGKRTPDGSMREFHFNAVVARYVRDALQEYEGVQVMFTHADNRDVPLKERTDTANKWGAELLVSIHANAFGNDWNTAGGIETFVYTSRPASSVAVATAVQRRLIAATKLPDRGVKAGNLHMVREARGAAILVECGFMTNRAEASMLKMDTYRRTCATAIVAGIVDACGLKKRKDVVQVDKVDVYVDGKKVGEGELKNGVTFTPSRAVAEALGATVEWKKEQMRVDITRGAK